jgi:VWFA-related protein
VRGLRQDDFLVFEDDQPQAVTLFSAERVPVSLGLVLDTSGSMEGERIAAARRALDRFLEELLDPTDEVFLYRFSDRPVLVQGWTSDRHLLSESLGRLSANGSTAMLDAVAAAVHLVGTGQHRKKAFVLLSDGNDTTSETKRRDLQRLIRETDALLYAIGLECGANGDRRWGGRPLSQRRGPIPIPTFPPRRPGWPIPPEPRPIPPRPQGRSSSDACHDRVDGGALHDLTDDSGGRTEIVRSVSDLVGATTRIADELRQQYSLAYVSNAKADGRWRAIRVEVRNRTYRIRARRGYIAS